MMWQRAGETGEQFVAKTREQPGWYWIFRPRNLGPGRYAEDDGMLLLVHVDASGQLHSPLADFSKAEAMVVRNLVGGQTLQSWFAGPVSPGAHAGFLSSDGRRSGSIPAEGWHWCRTQTPLEHVDADGVGPIYLAPGRDGRPWVWLSSKRDGSPVDVGELGFAEPLLTEQGVIDSAGEVGRTQAEFLGRIPLPVGVPAGFGA